MIQLRALGTLVLRNHAGEDVRPVLAQPKRVALLVYLAAARPLGFHRRDSLLALLWPEQDELHARWALNQALRHLRGRLGRDVVVSRGDGEVGVEPQQLSCDIVQFETAIAGGDHLKALELYRGDLLEGFHLSGCGEFERWLEEERGWLRSRAARSASLLAEQKVAEGEPLSAGEWARRAFGLCPDDEGEARNLIELLDRVGDRAGALQAYEDFARRLHDEYQVDPAPETSALIASVRARHGTLEPMTLRPAAPVVSAPVIPPAVAPVITDEPGPRRRRVPALAAAGALAIVVSGGFFWSFQADRPVPAPSAISSTIAVLPFTYAGAPELAYLGQGMVDLLSANLSGAGDIRTVEPRVVHSLARRQGGNSSGLGPARRVGTQLQAGSVVLGEVVEAGGQLRITARLYPVAGGEDTATTATVQGMPTQLFRLVDGLTAQLIAGRSGGPAARLTRLAALTTDSLQALKAYLEGERYFRDGKSDAGVRAMERAVRIDSSFALAHYRLATMAMWADQEPLARISVARALRFGARLGYRDRELMEALAKFLNGRLREAERAYSDILSWNPNDLDANYLLGELIFHNRGPLGRSWLDAREPLEHVLALEPGHESSLYHLSNIAAREGRLAELDSLTERVLKIGPGRMESFFRGQRAVAFGDTAEITRYLAALEKMPEEMAQPSGGFVVFTTGNLTVGRRIWRSFTEASRSPETRLLAYMTLAKIELMNGRWSAAKAELDAGKALNPATALQHRALLSLWPLLTVPSSELLALRDSLLSLRPTTGGDPRAHPLFARYLLGLLEARLNNEPAALRYAAELERLAGTSIAPAYVRDWGRTVRAEVARARGRNAEALALLDTTEVWNPEDLNSVVVSHTLQGVFPFFASEYKQFARAEAFNALGRDGYALLAYHAIADELFHSGAPAQLRLAQIYERRGERQKAAEHYTRFIELWKDCDPELRPLVEEARRQLLE